MTGRAADGRSRPHRQSATPSTSDGPCAAVRRRAQHPGLLHRCSRGSTRRRSPSGGSGTGTPTTVYGGLGLRQMNVDGVSNNLQGGARNLVISEEAIAGVPDGHQLLGRVRPRRRRAAERDHAIGQQRAPRLGLPLHAAEVAERDGRSCCRRPRRSPSSRATTTAARWAGRWSRDRVFYFVNYERWMADAPAVSTFTPAERRAAGHPARQHRHLHARRSAPTRDRAKWTCRLIAEPPPVDPLLLLLRPRVAAERRPASPRDVAHAVRREAAVVHRAARVDPPARSWSTRRAFLFATRGISNGVAANPDAPNITSAASAASTATPTAIRRTRERGHPVHRQPVAGPRARTPSRMGFDMLPVSVQGADHQHQRRRSRSAGCAAVPGVRGAVTPTDQFLLHRSGRDRSGDRPAATPTRASRSRSGPSTSTPRTFNQGYFIQDDIRLSSTG